MSGSDFTRTPQRFLCAGVSVNAPADALGPGKFPYLLNIRSYEEGTLTVRTGTQRSTTLPAAVHSLFRLNDPTPLNAGIPAVRAYGVGGALYLGAPDAPPALIDSGYSGNPLVALTAEPVGTIQPYLYLADSQRMRKVRTDGTVYPIGITPPTAAPLVALGPPGLKVLDNFDTYTSATTLPWVAIGAASPPGVQARVQTTIQTILYDTGTTGNALIAVVPVGLPPSSDIRAGMVLLIGTEDVLVQETKVAIEPTTVASATQDAVTGLWSIQPVGGLGTGIVTQLQSSTVYDFGRATAAVVAQVGAEAYRVSATGNAHAASLVEAAYARTRNDPSFYNTTTDTITFGDQDFPAGGLVQIGAEWTKVQSIQTGLDGLIAFQCHLAAPPVVGATLQGAVAYRVNTAQAHVAGDPVVANAIQNSIQATPPDTTGAFAPATGGVALFALPGSGGGVSNPASAGANTLPALAIPNHTGVVQSALAAVAALGVNLTTPCGLAEVAIQVAAALASEGCGLLRFTGGPGVVCAITTFGAIRADAVCYPNGQVVTILSNPAGTVGPPPINVPQWVVAAPSPVQSSNYIAVGPTTSPLPVVPGGFPTPPGAITAGVDPALPGTINGQALQPDDRLHISLYFSAALASVVKVQILYDVDAVQNDFTRNYFLYEADGNALTAAIQSTPGGASSTTPSATLTGQLPVTAVQSPSTTQLPLGANQWVELTWKLKDMLRVGTDDSRGFSDVAAIGVLVTIDSTLGNLIVRYGSIYLEGGQNPDVGTDGAPFRYRYRFRSSITGARSNPTPQTRQQALLPIRQSLTLTAPVLSTDPQVDLLDWFRIGGVLTNETYVGSSSNTGAPFVDNFADETLVGNDILTQTLFQPWPTTDQPRAGTCTVSGALVTWVSGDPFNPDWAPGAQILVNGLPYTLYASPASATQLSLIESAGSQPGPVPFQVPAATLQGTPLGVLFGPFQGYLFAVGDPNNPGALYWTNANDPDAASDANFLQVTDSSVPLVNGFIWDFGIYVWSTEDLYRIVPTGDTTIPFYAQKTPCGRGLWSTWAWCQTPQGTVFLGKDGVFLTNGGSVAQSLTDADLSPLFPHDGGPGQSLNGIGTPNMGQPSTLRLAYVDGYVYFDYAV